jgi:hypothetical protein
MIVSKDMERAPRTDTLVGWVRSIASRFVGRNELQGLDDKEFEQIARDLNLSVCELHALSTKGDLSGDLLSKRLAEFGLSADKLKARHPEVLRDLQRVCGNCTSTKRCADEFKQAVSTAKRSDYCPNTQTLQALENENLQSGAQPSLPVGPCCC